LCKNSSSTPARQIRAFKNGATLLSPIGAFGMIAESQLEQIKNVIQDCNLNFLLGSGLSSPYLKTLGNIETLSFGH
jgi:hypothetical protein